MPKKKTTVVAPLPQGWLDAVIPLLDEQDPGKIHWTGQAEHDMAEAGLGFKYEAYELCLRVLQYPGMLGEQILDMVDAKDNTICETWAFLCPNPLGNPDPIFAKIGLHQGRLHINLFSLHVDRSGKLKKAIRAYLKRNK